MYQPLTALEVPSVVAACAACGRAVYLHGAAGIGKSAIIAGLGHDPVIKTLAWDKWSAGTQQTRPDPMPDLEMIHLTLPQLEAEDFAGVPFHRRINQEGAPEDRVTCWAPVEVLRRSVPVILFLDEVSSAEIRVQKVLLQIVNERKIANVDLALGTLIVLAGNRAQDRAAVKTVPFTLGNRAAHFELVVSAEAWLEWASTQGLPGAFLAYVRQHGAAALHAYEPSDPSLAQLTPRSYEAAARAYQAGQAHGLPAPLLDTLVLANIGQEHGLKLTSFLRLRDMVPQWEDIVTSDQARLPDSADLSATYYTMGLLVDRCGDRSIKDADLAAGVRYLSRIVKANPYSVDAAAWAIDSMIRKAENLQPAAQGAVNRGKSHRLRIVSEMVQHEVLAERLKQFLTLANQNGR